MRYSEQFTEHIEYAFNAFCKIVLRYEAVGAWRDLKRKEAREISLDYLMSKRFFEPSATVSNRIVRIAEIKAGSPVALLLCRLS